MKSPPAGVMRPLEDIATAQVVDLNPIATFVINDQHVVTHWNLACERLTGCKAEDIIGTSRQWQPFYPNERPVMADIVLDGARESDIAQFYSGKYRHSKLIEGAFEAEDYFPHFSGGCWLFFTAALLRDPSGKIIGAIETLQDITARRQAEAALHHEQARLTAIINGSAVPTFVIDTRHHITHLNRAYEILFEVTAGDLVGTSDQWRPIYPLAQPVLADLLLDNAPPEKFSEHHGDRWRPSRLLPGGVEAEGFFPHLGTEGRWLYLTAAPLQDDQGKLIGVLETLQDITERKQAEIARQQSEERYRQLSATDGLTGLGNLRSCYEHLDREMARSKRYASPLSILLFDVDNFKQFNDTWGHMEGDSALKALAAVILTNLRVSDSAFRYGGEEFVIILPETTLDQACMLAERIRMDYASTLLTPAENITTSCTVSIGIAQFRAEDTAKSFLNRADEGTYQAKAHGKNKVVAVS